MLQYNEKFFLEQKADAEKFIKNRCKEIYNSKGLSETGRREVDKLRDKYLNIVKIELRRKKKLIQDVLWDGYKQEKKAKKDNKKKKRKSFFDMQGKKDADSEYDSDIKKIEIECENKIKKYELAFSETVKRIKKNIKQERREILLRYDSVYILNKHNRMQKKRIKKSGEKGEKDVKYTLEWLDSDKYYKRYNVNINCDKGSQEIDCIIISTKGVFNIEVKSYGLNAKNNNADTKLIIDSNGQWKLNKNGREKILENPSGQIYRHHKCIEEVMNINSDIIIDVLVLANKRLDLNNRYTDTTYDIVKLDLLIEYIEKHREILTEKKVNELQMILEKNM